MMNVSYGNKTAINADGRTIEMERIRFEDINKGDVVAHVWNEVTGDTSYWVGKADLESYNSWYGVEQSRHTAMTDDEWDDRTNLSGVTIAHKWHDETAGHQLFRVLSAWDYWDK